MTTTMKERHAGEEVSVETHRSRANALAAGTLSIAAIAAISSLKRAAADGVVTQQPIAVKDIINSVQQALSTGTQVCITHATQYGDNIITVCSKSGNATEAYLKLASSSVDLNNLMQKMYLSGTGAAQPDFGGFMHTLTDYLTSAGKAMIGNINTDMLLGVQSHLSSFLSTNMHQVLGIFR
ncbi:MAG TPA: hypothetical protein VND15_03380 [Candidatus Acidoferrales bacterium]|nr:hypothetical protein [Candidatus Acidoferrales bacterium]